MGRAPWHLKIEPRTGQLIEDYDVNITNDGNNYSDGKLVGKGFYEIKFNKVEARYIRLVMKSEVNGMGWSSAAEINLGDENGENIDRSKWRAHYTDKIIHAVECTHYAQPYSDWDEGESSTIPEFRDRFSATVKEMAATFAVNIVVTGLMMIPLWCTGTYNIRISKTS